MTEATQIGQSVDAVISPEDAAKQLGCTVGTLAKWRSTGKHAIPFLKYGESARAAIRYRQSAIDAFLVASEVGGASQ
ncbi:MAG: helix-turn-helix domain-containing protein [Gammaproteobacteria bacterium]|nr:helix-turn-helix domain-containing protein [Gammaproteobacteria bacterium]